MSTPQYRPPPTRDIPIYEPDLAAVVQRKLVAGNLVFTTDAAPAVGRMAPCR